MKAARLGFLAVLVLTTAMAPVRSAPVPAVRTIDVVIHYSQFTPSRVSVRLGSTVRFRVVNTDPIDHEFILGDAALQHHEEAGTDLIHNGMVPGQVSVPAGSTGVTQVTFTTPPAGGSLIYACHLPGHYAYGMRGTLLVTP